jgi:Cu-Zn family superoxide dismutase
MHKSFSTRTVILGVSTVLGIGSGLFLTGCPKGQDGNPHPETPATLASANIESRSNSTVVGTATFEQVGPKVKVAVEVSGATPGQHGVHIHAKGDCSAPDAASAGPHFNPGNMKHGGPEKPMHHAGDFGNLTIGEDGKGKLEFETDQISVGNGALAVVDRAIVFHEKPDDMDTDPSGNSGSRQGCGVITAKK